MEGLGEYALGVITAAIGCSILTGLAGQSASKDTLRILSGVILTLVAIRPLAGIQIPALESLLPAYETAAESAVEEGTELAQDAMADIIIAACEAYILDKATALGAEISISIALDENSVPASVSIHGTLSPGAKQSLETILETDLGIAKENQVWQG